MSEEFRPVSGFEGIYEISNLGRIMSLPRDVDAGNGRTRRTKKIIRKTCMGKDGYVRLSLKDKASENVIYAAKIHRLMAEAFIPNPESKPEINHIDGNKSNNECFASIPALIMSQKRDKNEIRDMVEDELLGL